MNQNKYDVRMPMTVRDFCLHRTEAMQLCVIRDGGWIRETVWIDHEDLFRISNESKGKRVKRSEYGTLPVVGHDGKTVKVPCVYIEV